VSVSSGRALLDDSSTTLVAHLAAARQRVGFHPPPRTGTRHGRATGLAGDVRRIGWRQ